jgi:hypothetical protein
MYGLATNIERVLWEDWQNFTQGKVDLYMSDLAGKRELRVTTPDAAAFAPAVSGRRIAWPDKRFGSMATETFDVFTMQLACTS